MSVYGPPIVSVVLLPSLLSGVYQIRKSIITLIKFHLNSFYSIFFYCSIFIIVSILYICFCCCCCCRRLTTIILIASLRAGQLLFSYIQIFKYCLCRCNYAIEPPYLWHVKDKGLLKATVGLKRVKKKKKN